MTRREALRRWRAKNPEKVKAQMKRSYIRRRNNPAAYARILKQAAAYRKRTREKWRNYDRARDKKKVNARCLIRNKIFRGKLTRKPCYVCGQKNAHAHHENYDKPLEVKWLCPQHHAEEHHVK